MHLSEGVLSTGALATGWVLAGAGTAVGLKKLESDKIVRVALLSSAFFLASLINVRIGPSASHLSLLAPMGLMLGWEAFPAVMVALVLQALLFHFGGLLVLGVNATSMAGAAVLVWLLFGKAIRKSSGKKSTALAFTAGALAVLTGAFVVCLFLWTTDSGFVDIAKILFAANIPVAVIEGLVTAFLVSYLKKAAPEFLMQR